MVEVAEENRRLRRLLRLKAAVPYRTVAARVIAVDAGGWSEQVVLDKGRADGVDSERGVISESGLVGQVFAVTAHTASVVLVTDRNSSVAAMVGRSRTAGIVKGTGHGTCVMTYLPPQADVRVGDRILTSGRGGIFPKGLPIGTVTKVERHDFNSTTSATLRAGAVQDRLEEVLVMDR
jgi:rod shape-determining protein MreC